LNSIDLVLALAHCVGARKITSAVHITHTGINRNFSFWAISLFIVIKTALLIEKRIELEINITGAAIFL